MPGGVFTASQEAAYPYPPTFREEVFSETRKLSLCEGSDATAL
jgi:hypothetical protein